MSNSNWKLTGMIGAVLMLAVFAPAWAAEAVAEVVLEGTASDEPAVSTCAATDDVELQEVGLEISIGRKKCLPSSRLTCDDMPIPHGGTCSCQSILLEERCKNCDTNKKGQVLQTTCTVHVPCTNPPCDIQQNITRTGRSCVN
jgi:hypothetical protein